LGEKGYPLITWIMTPFKEEGQHSILKLWYNRKHKRRRLVVENAFGILKKTFRKLRKFKLHVTFLPDVFTCCCLLHNLFRFENETSIIRLLWIIELEMVYMNKDIIKLLKNPWIKYKLKVKKNLEICVSEWINVISQ
jgi:hypothetical protein